MSWKVQRSMFQRLEPDDKPRFIKAHKNNSKNFTLINPPTDTLMHSFILTRVKTTQDAALRLYVIIGRKKLNQFSSYHIVF